MAFRYCPECDQWYETAGYTTNDNGETVCKKDDHDAVHGYINRSIETVSDFVNHQNRNRHELEDEIDAAVRQGLLEE